MKKILFSFLYLIVTNCFSQIDYGFILHLQENKLRNEHITYLNSINTTISSPDSLNFLYAKYFLEQQNDSLFFKYYKLSENIFNNDSNALKFANYQYLRQSSSYNQNKWFNQINSAKNDSFNLSILSFYNSLNPNSQQNSIPFTNYNLNHDLKKYHKLKHKSPLLAACLSGIIPGLGKLYGQRPNSAMITFFSQGVNAYQAIESIKTNGIKNGFSIFTVSFFSFFYVSNIYGSFHDLKTLKKQKQKQLLIDAEKIYNINYPAPLY